MSQSGDPTEKDRGQRALNLTLAVVAGQVGCITLVIVVLALIIGLWLDSQLNTRPLFTLILMIGSVPVTLVIMFWVVRKATSRISSETTNSSKLEESEQRGKS
jgi:F0F1-type ATP synthase assembly protein I